MISLTTVVVNRIWLFLSIIWAWLIQIHIVHLIVQALVVGRHAKVLLLRCLHHLLLLHWWRRLDHHLLRWGLHSIGTWVES
jgi:hypothetical protein